MAPTGVRRTWPACARVCEQKKHFQRAPTASYLRPNGVPHGWTFFSKLFLLCLPYGGELPADRTAEGVLVSRFTLLWRTPACPELSFRTPFCRSSIRPMRRNEGVLAATTKTTAFSASAVPRCSVVSSVGRARGTAAHHAEERTYRRGAARYFLDLLWARFVKYREPSW